MALDTVVYPQDPFGYLCKEYYNTLADGASNWDYDVFTLQEEDKSLVGMLDDNVDHGLNWDSSSSSLMQNAKGRCWDHNSSPEVACTAEGSPPVAEAPAATTTSTTGGGRRKRRRVKSCKNKEELENQRMTHIAVERNRRKQMNEYLAVIRSLMPPSYVQRGDQASIIGGAINFVKELEQHIQTLEAQKRTTKEPTNGFSPLFADFFAFPQYLTHRRSSPSTATGPPPPQAEEDKLGFADIEVTVAESHANLKILSKRRPRQLLKMVAGLQCRRLTVLHLNVTTVAQMVLYSLSVKIEEGCQLTTVDEIADAINGLLGRIEEEAALS